MKRFNKICLVPILTTSLPLGCAEEAPKGEEKPRLVRAIKIGDAQLDYAWVPGKAKATRSLELSLFSHPKRGRSRSHSDLSSKPSDTDRN